MEEIYNGLMMLMGLLGVFLLVIVAIFIVLYIVGCIFIYEMAEDRGRNAIAWALISFFLTTPYIAIPTLFFLGDTRWRRKKRVYEEELIREKARKREPMY